MSQPADRIIELLQSLQGCLCAELTPEGEEKPPTCLCIPIPGAFNAMAYSGDGEDAAWVRLQDMFPSNTPGVQWSGPFDQSVSTTLLVEVGVVRCFDWPQDGSFGEDDLLAIWEQQMRDAGALQRAIHCCTNSTWDASQLVVGNYRPIGPEANMTGGMIVLALQLD